MKQISSILFLGILLLSCSTSHNDETLMEARGIIDRFTGGKIQVNLELSLQPDEQGHDRYAFVVKNGVLTVKGSSGVALCHGFYAYVKSLHAGISSWSGNRFECPTMNDTISETITSPFLHHQMLNVVTFGYSMPYWDEARWDEELDRMALHGVDMPLCLMGQEAIYRQVFKDMGLTDAEIDEWLTGPAHLPWMRMGNLSGNTMDGPLSREWDEGQLRLTRHILKRMRALGMKPIFPAFGGFVPRAFLRHFHIEGDTTGWNWVSQNLRNTRIRPENPYFVEVGRRFIQQWEKNFGRGEYYLSDSFNEMNVPKDTALLTAYGDSIYESIRSANPNATWVMQGWTLGYQKNEWNEGCFESLVKHVPDDKMLILDMANDYNRDIFDERSWNWEAYPRFYGKQWIWSVIPNMGGKTAMTGVLDFYANGVLEALRSPMKGHLIGFGFAPEGIENNEMIYELLSDRGWSRDSIDLDKWLDNYARCRYGRIPIGLNAYYQALRQSVYGSFTDHPRYGWQYAPYTHKGTVNQSAAFNAGVDSLLAHANQFASPLWKADVIEAQAFVMAGRVEELCIETEQLLARKQALKVKYNMQQIKTDMLQLDSLLAQHPLYRLDRWEEQARRMGTTDAEQACYARNARRLVTTWIVPHEGSEPVNDYAARLWSGLVKNYYLPRLLTYFQARLNGVDPKPLIVKQEEQFVEQ